MGNSNNNQPANNGGANNNNQPAKQQQQLTQPVKINSGYYRDALNNNVKRLPLVNINNATWLIGELIDIEQRIIVTQRVVNSTLRINANLAVTLAGVSWYQFSQRGELTQRINHNVNVITTNQREYDALINRQRLIHMQLDTCLNVIKRG